MPRLLTANEQQALPRRMQAWLTDCTRWSKDFRAAQPTREEAIARYSEEKTPIPAAKIDGMLIAATYHIVACGCVLYHAQEIIKGKSDYATSVQWLKDQQKQSIIIRRIYARRTLLVHGAVNDTPDFEDILHFASEPDKTFEQMDEEAKATGYSVMKPAYNVYWHEADSGADQMVTEFQAQANSEMERVVQEAIAYV